MNRKIMSLVTVVLVSATATAGVALADKRDHRQEAASFLAAKQAITAAISAAEGSTGGKAVKAEFDEKKGTSLWKVRTVNGTKRADVRIDATTGQVIDTRDKGDVSAKRDSVTPDMLGGALADLISKAEAAGGGKVMSIDVERRRDGGVGVEVELVKADGTAQDFLMNPADGKLTPKADHDDSYDDEN